MRCELQWQSRLAFTVIELLVALAITGILAGIAIINLHALSSSSANAAAELATLLKQARARAISSTSAYFVVPISTTQVVTRFGTNCSDTTLINDPTLSLSLPSGTNLGSISWTICFTSRGLSDSNTQIPIYDLHSQNHQVEVLLGGSVRIT
ncbi:MAG: type II secretion system GspH family protein [Oligoflexia bacterium]|nr:type II secretion system GspH family protein [Oligoflexia bacterium]